MRRVPFLIIGGGVSGLSAAYHLSKQHLLIERESSCGGLARSISDKGFTFDYTGHLLHLHNEDTTKLIRSLLGRNIQKHRRSAWIYSHQVYTPYPYQVNTYRLPEHVKEECIDGLSEALDKLKPSENPRQSFAEWVMARFGMGFAKHFFFPYNRKLWTTDPVNITAEWTGQFVPQPALEEVIKGATTDYDKDFGYNSNFYYPKTGGIGQIADGFLKKGKINIEYETSLFSIVSQDHVATIVNHKTGEREAVEYEHLINTIPLPELLKRISDLPTKLNGMREKLKWTTVICVNVGVSDPNVGEGKHWVYFPESKFPFYRVGFPHNFSQSVAPAGCGSMYVEVSVPGSVAVTQEKLTDVVFQCVDGLKECGLLKSVDQLVTIKPLVIPYGYVIYNRDRTPTTTLCLSELNALGIHGIGRYGGWKYSFMESDIGEAKALSGEIGNGVGKSSGRMADAPKDDDVPGMNFPA